MYSVMECHQEETAKARSANFGRNVDKASSLPNFIQIVF